MIVKDTLTPLSRDEASRAFLAAYQQLTGKLPSARVLALLLAQSAFETGHWKSLHNFNFGNAKAGPGYPLITQFRCSEVDEQGVEHFFDPPAPECNFRAYEDAAAGALDYLKVLRNRPHWWQGLHTEDPAAFVDALSTPPKYFTGNPTTYKRSVVSLFQSFFPLAEVALAVASVRKPPAPAPAPAPSSSSASPPSDSSGVRPAPSNGVSSASAVCPPTRAPERPAAPPVVAASATIAAPAPPLWLRILRFAVRIARLLFRGAPPGGTP